MPQQIPLVPGLTPSPIRAILAQTQQEGLISFAGGLPDPILFPRHELAECAAAALRSGDCLQYAGSAGLPGLREAVAGRLAERGLPTAVEQVLITNGSQHGLAIAARLLAGPGRRIVLESPAYPGARQAAELSGADVSDLPLGADGVMPDLERLQRMHEQGRIAAVLGMTTARNPTGRTLDRSRRAAYAAHLARLGIAFVEDDAYADLWYEAPPPPPLAAMHADTVLSGSFSKVLAPGLRLGWLRVPARRTDAAGLLLQATCLHANGLAQATVLAWLRSSCFASHLADLRQAYGARRDAMLRLLAAFDLPCPAPEGGMFCWLPLPAGMGGAETARELLRSRIATIPESAFHAGGGPDRHLRLCFTGMAEPAMAEGLAGLAEVLRRRAA